MENPVLSGSSKMAVGGVTCSHDVGDTDYEVVIQPTEQALGLLEYFPICQHHYYWVTKSAFSFKVDCTLPYQNMGFTWRIV